MRNTSINYSHLTVSSSHLSSPVSLFMSFSVDIKKAVWKEKVNFAWFRKTSLLELNSNEISRKWSVVFKVKPREHYVFLRGSLALLDTCCCHCSSIEMCPYSWSLFSCFSCASQNIFKSTGLKERGREKWWKQSVCLNDTRLYQLLQLLQLLQWRQEKSCRYKQATVLVLLYFLFLVSWVKRDSLGIFLPSDITREKKGRVNLQLNQNNSTVDSRIQLRIQVRKWLDFWCWREILSLFLS